MMDSQRFPKVISALYALVDELESMFPGRKFTPDGHMVGSIGEAAAAFYYGLDLMNMSNEGYDALAPDGRKVEIKATQGNSVAFRSSPENVLVIRLFRDGSFEEIYNGSGQRIWDCLRHKKLPRNGQLPMTLAKLRKLALEISVTERIERLR